MNYKMIFAIVFSIPGLALAEGVGSGPNPFVDCGIGAALFRNVSWAAVTSNVIWDAGTTAVTSATLSPQTCSNQKIKAALLIRDTYAQIVEDSARGKGEHLTTALNILSCEARQQPAAIREIREGVGSAVSNSGYGTQNSIEKAGQLFNIINTAVHHNCAV